MSILRELVELAKLGKTIKESRLTDPEKEMLRRANDANGEIHRLKTAQTGEYVEIGGHDYFDDNDRAVQEVALGTLNKLIEKGLVRHEGGQAFCLTGEGSTKARELD